MGDGLRTAQLVQLHTAINSPKGHTVGDLDSYRLRFTRPKAHRQSQEEMRAKLTAFANAHNATMGAPSIQEQERALADG